ncbi:MAG TPA: M48 family metallopeptidase, partial [Rhodobacterales bacterium]|nr:M48 family metallopeptidase [Rhodobacterales bacterium]
PYPVKVTVLDHDLINAFTLPGGRIILFRGLIEAAQTPEEVAAVLAHEIGHAVHRDPPRDALRTAGSIGVLGLLFGDFAGGTAVLYLANSLINAKYSQAAESGADAYAHKLLTEAGLSPAALGAMFVRLREESGDTSGMVAHFSAHPTLAKRIEASMAAAEGVTARAPVLSPSQWAALRNICGANTQTALERVPDDLLGNGSK